MNGAKLIAASDISNEIYNAVTNLAVFDACEGKRERQPVGGGKERSHIVKCRVLLASLFSLSRRLRSALEKEGYWNLKDSGNLL